MIRRSSRKPPITLSLFPFLAVLVCTMGALIVLLVIVVHKARTEAVASTEIRAERDKAQQAELEELRIQKEDLEWRRSELEKQRSELQRRAADQRLMLSHLEDHIRRLVKQWNEARERGEQQLELKERSEVDISNAEAEVKQLQDELAARKAELEDAKKKSSGQERAYAIIPYDGPNGTRRRPIYIECTDQGIILQPEGTLLSPTDFSGSLGPGNPLDAALRTTREYLATYGGAASSLEPYPLLIVRPSGTVAYAVARAALKSWDEEFGYELVDGDMKLAYPDPDPALKAELEKSIAVARQRQTVLATIMPGRFKSSGTTGLVASSNGGFVPADGSPLPRGASTAGSSGGSGGGVGAASFSGTFREAMGGDTEGALTMRDAQQSAGTQSGAKYRTASSQFGSGLGAAGSMASTTNGSGTGTSGGTAGRSASDNGATPGGPNASPFGLKADDGSSNPNQLVSAKPGQPKNAGSSTTSSGNPSAKSGAQKSLAVDRGPEWGLPNRAPTSTGIQRFIQVQCLADRLVLLPEPGDYRQPVVVPMAGATVEAIDPFVSSIWKRLDGWGIAGDNCYWKPVLRVEVAPDAQGRFQDLGVLLEGSGLVVERKN